jgi:glycosyltransferase involved in cell wall biosynthesis
MTKISVILPIFNAAKYLGATLDCLVAQTHKNLEIICVLDAPTDDSEQVVKSFHDKRIKIVKHAKNIGLPGTRNTGASNATGDYLHFMDADDILSPDFYEEMLLSIKDADVAACSVFYEKKPFRSILFKNETVYGKDKLKKTRVLSHGWAWRYLIKTSFWNENKFSFPNLVPMEDKPVMVPMVYLANKVALCGKALYIYKNRKSSILNRKYTKEQKLKRHNNRQAARKIVSGFLKSSELSFPIDLVYLWVDGSDQKWLKRKNAELIKFGKLPVESTGNFRFDDNDELLFSLRSVEKFAPWINHIFIVTDNQIPKWLNTKNPKVTIVDHTEIMPAAALPNYSSSVIEFAIPKIPNLAEHFIYANDDMLFMAHTKPNYFFTKDGTPIMRVNDKKKIKQQTHDLMTNDKKFNTVWNNGSIHERNKMNSMKLVYNDVGDYDYHWTESHNIDAYRKSDMLRVIEMPTVKKILTKMEAYHFRHENALSRIIFYLFGIAKFGYVKVGRTGLTRLLETLTLRFRDQPVYSENIRKLMSENWAVLRIQQMKRFGNQTTNILKRCFQENLGSKNDKHHNPCF